MSTEDSNLPKDLCGDCQKMVPKIFKAYHNASYTKPDEKAGTERKLVKRRRKYSDETGRLWHGKSCPDCIASKRTDHNLSKSEAKKEELKKILGES